LDAGTGELPIPIPVAGPENAKDASLSLISRAKAGDVAAFTEIVLLHERQVLHTAWRILGQRELAQDAAQEVFLKLYRHLHRLDDERSLSPWLYRITVNACRDAFRRLRRGRATSLEELGEQALIETAHVKTESAIQLDQQRGILFRALKTLPEKERAALVLRDIEGLTTSEVASILGCLEVTVRSQVSRARVKIKRFIERLEKGRA